MTMRHINRRQFTAGFAGLAFATPAFAQVDYSGQYITAAKTKSPLLGPDNPRTEHWHFKTGSDLPVIRAKQGVELRLRVFNELAETILLHFFGVRGAGEYMTVASNPGEAVEVVFTPPDAGTFWFGPLLNASKQREMGLYGMLIVDEADALPYQDIPMIFDDWSLSEAGVIEEDFANLDRAAGEGRLGNWFTVNGAFKARIDLDPEKPARLRLLNVANTRTMNILFKGAEGMVIARDGQPVVPVSLGLQPLELAPGQRVDVLLLDAQEQVVVALDLFEDVVEAAFLNAPGYGRKTLPRDMGLKPNPVAVLDSATPPREMSIDIEGGLKGGLQQARVGKDVLDLRAMLEQGLAWSIGGAAGLGAPPVFEAKRNDPFLITFDNKTAFEQVLHIHGHVWTQQMPLQADQQGPQWPLVWTDTLVIPAKARRRVLLVADNPGTWAIQSLMAERSDAGLIAAFTVADMP
jgi:FtsP/CotA-like multicopper oxidase with cupredoxin domain